MKNIFRSLMVFLLLFCCADLYGSSVFPTLGSLGTGIRRTLKVSSTTALPDSNLIQFVNEAVVWTSTDIGGVEAIYKVTTVDNSAFYPIADSIVEVLFATFMRGDITKSIKAWHPEYFEDAFDLQRLDGKGDDQMPKAYNVWADTIQLMPTPSIAGDSLFIKCYIKHQITTPLDTNQAILFTSGFTEAAKMYACFLCSVHLKRWDDAAAYLKIYEAMKISLKQKYRAKFGLTFGNQGQ